MTRFLHPKRAWSHVEKNTTFTYSLGYRSRELLWIPFEFVVALFLLLYALVLTVAVGYPLLWFWRGKEWLDRVRAKP